MVGGGGTVLDPEVVSQILVRSRRRSALDELTPREQEVLQLMAEGRTNSAIAAALHVSVGSAEKHIASIFTQARPSSRRQREPPRAGGPALPRILNRRKDFNRDRHRSPAAGTPCGAAPPTLTPGGRTAFRALVVVIATVLVSGTVLTLGVIAWGVSALRVVADTKRLPTDMQSLVIDTGGTPAAVRITTARDAAEPRVELRLLKSAQTGDHTLTMTEDAGAVRLTVGGDGDGDSLLRWARAGEITVTLPPEQARRLSVTTQQEAGVLFAQADLDQLIARGMDGAVLLSGNARRIEVHNQHGSVIAREPISVTESFTADTTDGDVTVGLQGSGSRAPSKRSAATVTWRSDCRPAGRTWCTPPRDHPRRCGYRRPATRSARRQK